MRRKLTVESLKQFMRELAAAAQTPGKIYFTGGATALLLGFREQSIDTLTQIEPQPIRYPAIDPQQFRRKGIFRHACQLTLLNRLCPALILRNKGSPT